MMDQLTPKQERFIEAYLQTWNQTEAARQAGYKHPDVVNVRLMRYPQVREAIKARMTEIKLESDEVLARLAEQARLNYADFFVFEEDANGNLQPVGLNWEIFRAKGHLVKKLSKTRYGITLELVDNQAALVQIGKALGVLKENVEQRQYNEQTDLVIYMPENERETRDEEDVAPG